jgi:helix-turn-helix protein
MGSSERRYGLPTVEEAVALLRSRGYFVGALDHVTDEEGAAALLGCSRKTLQNWRAQRYGPPAYKSSRWFYSLKTLIEFMHDEIEKD